MQKVDYPTATRIERLLALLLVNAMRESTQGELAAVLRSAGFSNAEIAELLGAKPNVIAQQIYEAKRSKPSRNAVKARRSR
jgi:hypothetical protein